MTKTLRCLMAAFLLLGSAQAGEITGKIATATNGPIKNGTVTFALTQPAVVATGTSNPFVGGTCATGLVATGMLSNGEPICSAAAHNLLSTTHLDTTPAAVVRGDVITGQGGTPAWKRLALGSSGSWLCSDGTDAYWGTCTISELAAQIVPPRTDLSYAILYPTSYSRYTGSSQGSTTAGVGSGYITRTSGSGGGNWDIWMNQAGFALPNYVSAASVQYVYLVVNDASNHSGGIEEINAGHGTPSFDACPHFSGTDYLGCGGYGGTNFSTLLASGGAASSFVYSDLSVSFDNAASCCGLSYTPADQWLINSAALVVFYSGTQQSQGNALQVVAPLDLNTALNTLSILPASAGNDGYLRAGDWSTFNSKASIGTPTVGKAACIKSAGPPVVIGYCSTVVDSAGACTCN